MANRSNLSPVDPQDSTTAAGGGGRSKNKTSVHYDRLRLLVTDLDSATTITKRRDAGEALVSFFKHKQNRIGLAEDCITASIQQHEHSIKSSTSKDSNSKKKKSIDDDDEEYDNEEEEFAANTIPNTPPPLDPLGSLKKVMGHVIQTTIKASQKTLSSKSKLTVQDVTLVHKVLLAMDSPMSTTTTNSSSSTSKHRMRSSLSSASSMFVVPEPFTFDTFDRYRNTHVGVTLLSATHVQNILSYVLDALEEESIYSIAEGEWLELLKTLCCRVDYVCHFRLATDYNLIFHQLQGRLLYPTPDDDDHDDDNKDQYKYQQGQGMKKTMTSSTTTIQQNRHKNQLMMISSKIFHGLLVHSVVKLKLDMQIYLRPCVRLVADWTKKSYSTTTDEMVAQHLFSSIVPLVATYVESAVCVLADDTIGYPIWEYAIKWWDRTVLAYSRDALMDYFSVHVLICEIAGRLQGLLPGDLGDVGSASLDGNNMNHLRCRILSEKMLLSCVNGSLAANTSSFTSKNLGTLMTGRKNKSSSQSAYNSLHKRERRYLELCTRLLRCSQRIFLAKAEYEHALDREILGQFTDSGLNSDIINVSDDLYQESPWVEYVIHPLCAKNIEPYMAPFSNPEKNEGKSVNSSQTLSATTVISGTTFPPDPLLVVGYMQLICASAEIFPRGECWSSTNRWMRTKFCPYSHSLEGSYGVESFCALGTGQDLARVIRLITSILEYYAGIPGAETVQAWALICLMKLTESTVSTRRYIPPILGVDSECLASAWRSTWKTLFRSELRYTALTTNLTMGSLGELVVMLMTEIIQGECTDSYLLQESSPNNPMKKINSFLYAHQDDIWNLPLYKSVENVTTSHPLELISSLLSTADLREDTDDSFQMALSLNKDRMGESLDSISFRSFRIAMFCISVVESISKNAVEDTLTRLSPYISSCLSVLLGRFISWRTSYQLKSLREYQCTEDSVNSQDLIHVSKRYPSLKHQSCSSTPNDIIDHESISCKSLQSHSPIAVSDYSTNGDRMTYVGNGEIDLTLLWFDIISPFGEQFETVIDKYNWRGLHDMDSRLTPSWGAEERDWSLKRFDHKRIYTPTNTLMHMRSHIYQLTIRHLKRLTTEFGLTSSPSLLPLFKCTVSFYLSYNDDSGFRHELFDLFHNCMSHISSRYSSATDKTEWSLIALDLVGFFRLLRSLYERNAGAELFSAFNADQLNRIFISSHRNLQLYMKMRNPFIEAFNILGYDYEDLSKASDEYNHSHGGERIRLRTDDVDSAYVFKRQKLDIQEASGDTTSGILKEDNTLKQLRYCSSYNYEIVDTRVAWLSALLLLLMDPTCKTFQCILDYMIKPSGAARSSLQRDKQKLLLGETIDAIKLTSMKEPWGSNESMSEKLLFMDSLDPHDSFIGASMITSFVFPSNSVCLSLCSDVIIKGRSDAVTSCAFHFVGFLTFSSYLSRFMQSCSSGSSFNEEVYNEALSILDPERSKVLLKDSVKISRRSLRDRPLLRAVQLMAIKQCFIQGTDSFHEWFDLTYAEAFVKPFLASMNTEIRVAAIQCLAAALSIFPSQEQIVSETMTLLSFKAFKYDHGRNLGQWILCFAVQGQNKTIQSQSLRDAWSDSVQSQIFLLFECLAVICTLVSDEIRCDVLADIVALCPERSQFSTLIFRCLYAISRKYQYRSVEDLIAYHSFLLLECFLESDINLASLPIVFTYPSLILYQIRLNLSSSVRVNQMNPSPDYAEDLQALSLRVFLKNNLSTIMPRIIVSSSNQKTFKDGDKRWNLACEISMSLYESDSDANIARLIRKYFHDIYSYILPLIESKTNIKENRVSGLEAMDFLSKVLSKEKIDRCIAAYSHLVVKKLVQLSGKVSLVYRNLEVVDETIFRSIESVGSKNTIIAGVTSGVLQDIDVYQKAGTTLTEVLLYALKDFRSAVNTIEKTHVWQSLRNICTNILSDNVTVQKQVNPEVLLVTLKLLLLAADESDASMKLNILAQVCLIIEKILGFEGELMKNQDTPYPWKDISYCLIQIHYNSVAVYIDAYEENARETAIAERCSCSLISVVGEEWPETRTTDYNATINHLISVRAIVILIHDTLLNMKHHAIKYSYISYWKFQYLPQISLTRDQETSLRSLNEKFFIFDIIDNQRDPKIKVNMPDELKECLKTLKSHRLRKVSSDEMFRSSEKDNETVIIQALGRLIDIFDNVRWQVSETEATVLLLIRTELVSLCSANFPSPIRLSASKCLGHLFCPSSVPLLTDNCKTLFAPIPVPPLIELTNNSEPLDYGYDVMDSALPIFYNDPLIHIHTHALQVLANYIQSRDINIAIIAIDTVYALLDTTSYQHCLSYLNDDFVDCIISPMTASINRRSRVPPRVNGNEVKKLCKMYCTDGDRDISSICWEKSTWSSSENFNQWIRHITFILLTCCYGLEKELDSQNKSIRGSCDFFYPCASLCLADASFAALIFPGIIYDILNFIEGNDSATNRHPVNGSVTRREYIGSPDSDVNHLLTECVTCVLDKANPEATELVLSVLNMLRRITEHRFLQTSKMPNSSVSKDRQYPDDNHSSKKANQIPVVTNENYNVNLQPNPLWNGRQYGTVLQLNGLDVANAFALIRRWETALYYSEFYADNRLGTSGSLFERVTDQHYACGQFSISGFGSHIQDIMSWSSLSFSDESISQRIERFCDLYKLCLTQIDDFDEMDGLFHQVSFLFSNLTGSFKHNDIKTLNYDCYGSEVTKLLYHDAQMQTRRAYMENYGVESNRNVIACLKSLGVRHVLRNYMSCVIDDNTDDEHTKKYWVQIRNHLAEENWRMMLWSNIDNLQQSYASKEQDRRRISYNLDVDSKGFNEYFNDIATSLLSDDQFTFNLVASHCRISICDALDNCKGQLMGLSTEYERLIMQLNILNDFDDISTILFQQNDNSRTLITITDKWDKGLNENIDALTFQDVEFLFSSRELGIRILLRKKKMNQDIIVPKLRSHLLCLCKVARQFGAPNIAETALARLKHLHSPQSQETLIDQISIALEEARITALYGDSTLAVTKAKAIISNLQGIVTTEVNDEYKLLLAESCLQCGEWLMKTKSEASTCVLEKYLKPATVLSQTAFDNSRNYYRAKLLSDANFTLGDFAASSYESMEAKMKTHEFKVALNSSSYRASELRECVSINEDLKTQLEAIKNGLKGSSGYRKANIDQRDKERYHELEKKMHDLGQHMRTLEREIELETRERSTMKQNFNMYLKLAIQSYGTALSCCETSSSHSTHVFRFMSLWFQSSNFEHDIHAVMADLIHKIPSFHFVPLTYQIFSRIDKSLTELDMLQQPNVKVTRNFQRVLRLLVIKMCIDHPYHCLVQLLALSYGNKVLSGSSGKSSALYLSNVGESKVDACKDILKAIRHDGPSFVSSLIDSYSAVMSSYYNLAMKSTEDIVNKLGYKDILMRDVSALGKDSAVPSLDRCLGSPNRKLFDSVPCILTKAPILRASADYGGGSIDPIGSERIHSFESYFSLTETGIHRPKIVTCVGTSGKRYRQLVKGDDDIRQDAIMQQVFATINTLLRKNDLSSRDRGMKSPNLASKIITYSCVPITPNSGIIEWVNDAIPFGDCLVDKKIGNKQYQLGVHSKYYPGEWGNSLCRVHLKNSPKDQLRQSYDQICNHFSPAFRFFFLERFSHDLKLWYDARKRYVKSCAVNSIAGHILGIGDRHASNILVHQKSGDIVHIDFGIVFEQGKLLPTPEIVPFRLTRDVVDGMGPLGTDGTFVATAIRTLAVLRENTNALMTILSAVVSDPLYKWCINPITARLRQRDELEEGKDNTVWISRGQSNNKSLTNATADSDDPGTNLELENDAASRTLAKIVKKLQGFEDESSGESQTVEGQVRMLIQAAKNPDNLCQMYCGWTPWL